MAPAAPLESRANVILDPLLEEVGVEVDGPEPCDPQVHDSRFYRRVLRDGSLGLGEAYLDGWWDARSIDRFTHRILSGGLADRVRRSPRALFLALGARLLNLQRRSRASRHVRSHYERGLDLFRAMLDDRMVYSCGYWRDAGTLDQAQEAKLELVCRKLNLAPGMRFLDIGCGWGSLVQFAAQRYAVETTGITLSPEQAEVARQRCRGLPVTIRVMDYRQLTGEFDAIASVGMFEHVGPRNHRRYMEVMDRCLTTDGIALLHTIAGNERTSHIDPWIHRYVFPGAQLPTLGQIAEAAEGLFLIEDVHNLGPDYDRTLMAWHRNFEEAWPELEEAYSERFRRMWRYYLLSSAGAFRARWTQVFQVILARTARGPRGHLEELEPRV